MKRIVILTGSSLRHTFFRYFIALSDYIEVINSFCEGEEKSLRHTTEISKSSDNTLRLNHLLARDCSEEDFFKKIVDNAEDKSNPINLKYGDINNQSYIDKIIKSKPDLLIAYGCSIIKGELLNKFEGRFLNVHLGLSPYYRGSGTNYWPLVNNEPEYVGATFMYIDAGIDTGEIVHQIRAKYCWGDSPSQICNRLISEMTSVYREIIIKFGMLQKLKQIPIPDNAKIYKNKDFSEESVQKLYDNFKKGLVEKYLREKPERTIKVPIIQNDIMDFCRGT
jgi:phosphoribosylglycinamide formyltransferase 1